MNEQTEPKGNPKLYKGTARGEVWTEQKGIKAKEKLQMNGAFLHLKKYFKT